MTKLYKNKYKLLLFTTLLLFFVDAVLHKGQLRVLLPKKFIDSVSTAYPINQSTLVNKNKKWIKAANWKSSLQNIDTSKGGVELDTYFNSTTNTFELHHDPNQKFELTLPQFFENYTNQKLNLSIWLDIKNMDSSNSTKILEQLCLLRNKHHLPHKILVENHNAELLNQFADSNFYTVLYTPFFNPYLDNIEILQKQFSYIKNKLLKNNISALSGYYFQQPFLQKCFPNFPILTWKDNRNPSFINLLHNKVLNNNGKIAIVLS